MVHLDNFYFSYFILFIEQQLTTKSRYSVQYNQDGQVFKQTVLIEIDYWKSNIQDMVTMRYIKYLGNNIGQ